MTLQQRAQAIHHDTATTLALLTDTLRNIDNNLNGWPTRTTGANPDSPGTSSTTNGRDDGTTPDRARNDLETLRSALHRATNDMRQAAIITTRWGLPMLDRTAITERLAAIDREIWCTNHLTHQMREPRNPSIDNGLCTFCTDFRKQHKRLPPIEITDHRARHGRLNSLDITRLLKRADTRIAAEKRAAKQAEKHAVSA